MKKNGKGLPESADKVIYRDKQISEEIQNYWAIFAQHLINEANHRESRFYDRELGHFKMALGHDEKGYYISYHDVWNLEPGGISLDFGKPFEIYDRIYFDPQKIEGALAEQRKRIVEDKELAFAPLIYTEHQLENGEVEKVLNRLTGVTTSRYKGDKLLKQISTDADGNLLTAVEFIYDEEWNMIRQIIKNNKFVEQYEYNNTGTTSSIIRDAKTMEIVDGFGPAYEQALKEEKEHETSATQTDAQKRQGESEPQMVPTEERTDKEIKSSDQNTRQMSATHFPVRRRNAKSAAKPYYGHRPGGVDDVLAQNDARERAKMAGATENTRRKA